jgi:hypothetical protein
MPIRRITPLVFIAAAAAFFPAGCRQKTDTAAATAVETPAVTTTSVVTPGMPVAAAPAARDTGSTSVTVDPVEASQRNASRRRARAASNIPRRAAHEVPAGTILRFVPDQTISTTTARAGDEVTGELLDDLIADDNTVVAPSGARVRGRIDNVTASGRLGGVAQLQFHLSELEVNGRRIPIRTSTFQRTGDTHTKRDAGYIAGGAAVGAILGQVFGRDSKSTLEGAAAGAAAGTGVAAATGALDFEVEAGRPVAFTLEEPLAI